MGQMQFLRGKQTGAPALGTLGTGDLARLLDAALNAGFTTQSVTGITRSGAVATATTGSAHTYYKNQIVTIAGATQTDYNITVRIASVPSSTTFTYAVANSPVTPATGTITVKLAALGAISGNPWGIAFTATNQRAYRAATGLRHYLMVNDNSNTNTCIVRGFQSMSAVTTGTGPFPTVAQSSTNLKWPRPDPTTFSSVVNSPGLSNDDSWIIVGDEKRFYLGICTGSTGWRFWMGFGEAISYKPSDAFHSFLMGYANAAGDDTVGSPQGMYFGTAQASNQGAGAYYNYPLAFNRSADQVTLSKLSGLSLGGGSSASSSNLHVLNTSPGVRGNASPISGGIEVLPIEITENISSSYYRRGRLPGVLGAWGYPDFENNDNVSYSGLTNFSDVVIFRGQSTDNTDGMIFAVGDWDTITQ
jgi:hypothetical protein